MKETKTEKPKRLGIKCPADLVERLDELKWELRIPRGLIVERIIRLGLELWEQEADGERTNFERLEDDLFGASDCS